MSNTFDIKQIIHNKDIQMLYQPIISPKNSKLIGFEALVRGIANDSTTISPYLLFNEAKKHNLVAQLDRLCIEEAIKGFVKLYQSHPSVFLFINIDVTVIHQYLSNDYITLYAQENQIPPCQLILEINELPTGSLEPIKHFTNKYRSKGFHISLDDIGAGSSNLDRIPKIKPDIIKIDMELVIGIHKSFYKQQVVTMLIRLASSLGALIVAEGSEDIEDILFLLEKGAHFLQGYYINKPSVLNESLYQSSIETTKNISVLQRKHIKLLTQKRIDLNAYISSTGMSIINNLATCSSRQFETTLKLLLMSYTDIESAYVINERGTLVTNTVFGPDIDIDDIMNLYIPATIDDSVELEAYYYNLTLNTQVQYVSEPYISRATGSTCITMSAYFYNSTMNRHILCLDFVF